MDNKIIPTCRYGHGNLERHTMVEGDKQLYKVDTFPRLFEPGDPNAYIVFSFAIYKCPKCTYMEFHDEVS